MNQSREDHSSQTPAKNPNQILSLPKPEERNRTRKRSESADYTLQDSDSCLPRNCIYTNDPNCLVNINKFQEERHKLLPGKRRTSNRIYLDTGTNNGNKSQGTRARTASNTRGSFFNESTSKNSKNVIFLDPNYKPSNNLKISHFRQQRRRPSSLALIREQNEEPKGFFSKLFCGCVPGNETQSDIKINELELPQQIMIDTVSRKSSEKDLTHMSGVPSQQILQQRKGSLKLPVTQINNLNSPSLFYNQKKIEVDLSSPKPKRTPRPRRSSKDKTVTISLSNIPDVPPIIQKPYESLENLYKAIKDMATLPDFQNLASPLRRSIAKVNVDESASIVVEILGPESISKKHKKFENSGSLRIKVMNNVTGEVMADSLLAMKNSSGGSIGKARRATVSNMKYRKSLHNQFSRIKVRPLNDSVIFESSNAVPHSVKTLKARPEDDFIGNLKKFTKRTTVTHNMNVRTPKAIPVFKNTAEERRRKKMRCPVPKAVTTGTNSSKEFRIMKPKFLKTATRVLYAKKELIEAYLDGKQAHD